MSQVLCSGLVRGAVCACVHVYACVHVQQLTKVLLGNSLGMMNNLPFTLISLHTDTSEGLNIIFSGRDEIKSD